MPCPCAAKPSAPQFVKPKMVDSLNGCPCQQKAQPCGCAKTAVVTVPTVVPDEKGLEKLEDEAVGTQNAPPCPCDGCCPGAKAAPTTGAPNEKAGMVVESTSVAAATWPGECGPGGAAALAAVVSAGGSSCSALSETATSSIPSLCDAAASCAFSAATSLRSADSD